ncbi:unnamed protein product [Ostreobium quekettii]|uniref:U-box domain-containing protein n=1 Tax=Ostreobium quekettii TaxID=121088 RepID=A0A8S1IQ38_9CHLO|nr:unnamed protein product [Ostreobium quekettii]|eukprot:evm.model.scf_614.8 EVM.evm.TU.scf_614.8   scf_614:54295-56242(-)
MGPFEWHDEDGQFVDDGLVVTGIIIAGIFLLVLSFIVIHLLRRLGFCYGAQHSHSQSVSEEYRRYRQERLDTMYAHVSVASGQGSPHEWISPGQHTQYLRVNSQPIPSVGSRDHREQNASLAQGMESGGNPHSGRLTYIRFSPSGIRYTNQSILVPSSGVRRNYTNMVPILPRGARTQPMDVQRGRHRGRVHAAYSPWTDSFVGSPCALLGPSRDTTNGRLVGEGVPVSVEGCTKDHEGFEDSSSATAEAYLQQIVDLFTCPITHEIMVDPVMAADGYTYERKAIMQWLKAHRRSPMTNEPLVEFVLIANHGLKSMIQDWKSRCEDEGRK